MFIFKACYRCGGDLNVDNDLWGVYEKCMQCGIMSEIEEDPRVRAPVRTLEQTITRNGIVSNQTVTD